MAAKLVKLNKKDDIASVIKKIKNIKDREIIFELEKGSNLLASSDNLKMAKRAGEMAGKTVLVKVSDNDEMGKVLAHKAGVLYGSQEIKVIRPKLRVARSDVKPKFSDIMGMRPTAQSIPVEEEGPRFSLPGIPKLNTLVKIPSIRRPAMNTMRYFIVGISALVIAALLLAIFLPQATVKIYARSEPVERDFEIAVDKTAPNPNSAGLIIPGIAVNQEVSQTKNFAATGVKPTGTKATGSVQLYNFTSNTLTLKAATTTLVANGKKFFFTKDATGIKATGNTPNAPVAIVAESAGADYNLPADTKFQIVNAALGNQNVYAMNQAAFTGGSTDTSTTVVSQEDLDNAAAKLSDEILARAADDLTTSEGLPVAVLPSGVKFEILTKTANKNAGDVAASFDMTLIARVSGLAFRQNDVTNMVVDKIEEVLSSDKYLLMDNGQSKYTAQFKNLDLVKQNGILAVHFETVAAYKIDEDNLSKILAGKNESEIKEILLAKPEVDNVQVTFWPAWLVHKAPRFNGKIYIKPELSPINLQ